MNKITKCKFRIRDHCFNEITYPLKSNKVCENDDDEYFSFLYNYAPSYFMKLASKASMYERYKLYESAAFFWLEASKVAIRDENIHWSQSRYMRCLLLSSRGGSERYVVK